MSGAETEGKAASAAASVWLDRALAFFMWTYIASFFVSMAGMELSAWGAFAVALIGMWTTRSRERRGLAGLGWRPFSLGAVDGPMLALIAVVLIGWALNWGTAPTLWYILGGIRWIATLYMTAWILRWREVPGRLLVPYAISLIVAGIYGVITFVYGWDFVRHRETFVVAIGGLARAVSFLGFPMTWGHTAAMATCFGFGALATRPFDFGSRRGRWLGGAFALATALAALNVGLTFTRGAWIGAVAGVVAVALALGRRAAFAILLIGALGVGALEAASPTVRARVASIFTTNETDSNLQRYQLWQANWQMFVEHPFFGVGLNKNEDLSAEYHAKLGHEGAFTGHAHNNFMQFLSSTGALGFALFVGIFGYFLFWSVRLLRLIPRSRRWHRAFLVGSIGAQVALHVGGLTECNFKAMSVNHHFIFQLALIAALRQIYVVSRREAHAARA